VLFEETAFPSRSFEHVVYALGGTTPTNFLKAIGIAFDGSTGNLSAGKKGGSINPAFNMAAEAMQSICGSSPEVCRFPINSPLTNE
jgi:hypothetical protein